MTRKHTCMLYNDWVNHITLYALICHQIVEEEASSNLDRKLGMVNMSL